MNVRTSIRISAIQELQAAFEDRLKLDEPLARYTSARVGGPAQLFLVVNSAAELETAVSIAYKKHIPYTLLGGCPTFSSPTTASSAWSSSGTA